MSGIQRSEAEKNNRNRYIEAMGQKLTADTARKIDGQLATNLNNSLNTTMQGVDDSTNRMLWAINRNQQIDAQESFVTEDAANLTRRNRVVTSTNVYSDLTQANIQSVSYQHELNKYNRALNTQTYGEQVRARYQRGNQMAADEFSKFQPVQNDLLAGVDVKANIAWGQQRRESFNQFRSNLSPLQSAAFSGGVGGISAVIDYGIGLGETAKYLVNGSGLNGTYAQKTTRIDLINRYNDFSSLPGKAWDMLSSDGAVRGSLSYQTHDKIIEGKVVAGSDLAGAQVKFSEAGKNYTAVIAKQLGIDHQNFKKDNINWSSRAAYKYSTGGDIDLIFETDFIKNEWNLGIGKFKFSYGARTTFDGLISSPAINFGWQFRGSQVTTALELRGAPVPNLLSELNNEYSK